jgi:DNA-binding HxlR family transcriptional regulator/anti-sigma regulatory factor (Ser/Thr protein kinase)
MQGPAEIVVAVQAESIKVARDWVEDVLREWGQDAYVAKVVVSELVTNVLRHTGSTTATVRVVQADKGTVVEVFDSCDVLPSAAPLDLLSEGGRGLAMLSALVKEWGAQPVGGGGKAVWALLHDSGAPTGKSDGDGSPDSFGGVSEFDVFLEDCPARTTLEVIGHTWSVVVIVALGERPMRHGDLLRRIGGISKKMLNQTLHRLRSNGLVRNADGRYELTDLGRSLLDPVRVLAAWAEAHTGELLAAQEATAEETGPGN